MTSINDFYSNLDNDPKFLRICKASSVKEDDSETDATKDTCEEITDLTGYVGTGMQVQLVSNHHIYDRLNIVVYGDIDSTGTLDSIDLNLFKNYSLYKYTFTNSQFLAADQNNDEIVDSIDFNRFKAYTLFKFSSFIES